MSYTRTWGQPVRDAVQSMALSSTATARAIHEALCAGVAAPAVGPDDIPPLPTIQRWVFEHRRAAREAVNGVPGLDDLGGVAHTLAEKLKRQARAAKTPAEIGAVAKAARELAGLKRDLGREAKTPGRPTATSALPATQEDAATAPDEAFVRELAEEQARASRTPHSPQAEETRDPARGPHDTSHHQNNNTAGAAAS